MHRTTTAEHLAHIIDETSLVILIVSRHLKDVVAAALKLLLARDVAGGCCTSSVKSVVWIEDDEEAYNHAFSHEHSNNNNNNNNKEEETVFPAAYNVSEHSWGQVRTLGSSSSSSSSRKSPSTRGAQEEVFPTRRVLTTRGDDIVKLLPTSGTTGGLKPKLVVITESMLRPTVIANSKHTVVGVSLSVSLSLITLITLITLSLCLAEV
jgi:long-subunit acyl-CoA synthetase (AMP-forming)